MKKIFLGISIIVTMLALTSCSYMASGLAASTTPLTPNQYKVLGHSMGKSTFVVVLDLFPTGNPDYDASIRDAVGKYPDGKAMINVRSYTSVVFLGVVSIYTLNVEGDVVSY